MGGTFSDVTEAGVDEMATLQDAESETLEGTRT
jgi:hypothetical protein